jgi:hypothetical protein
VSRLPNTPTEKLALAAVLIESALEGLDLQGTACDCCGHISYSNRSARQVRDSLRELPAKLRRCAGSRDAWKPVRG